MAEPTVIATPVAQSDPKTTAANITRGIQEKANGKQAPVPVAKEVPVDPNVGKEKYVVDGKEIWLSPEQARAYVQKGIAFEPKVSQLAHLQNETAQFLNDLKSDPTRILFDKRIGHTPEAVLEKILGSNQVSEQTKELLGRWVYNNIVLPSKMTPEQRQALETQKKLDEYESREASAKDMAIKQENQRRIEMALNQIKAQISEAMKESGLPTNDTPLGAFMARRVADVMRLGYVQKVAVTPKEAIEKVKNELRQIQTSWYDNLDEEQLVKELGEKNAEKVKKYFLKLVKDSEKQVPSKSSSTSKNGERKMTRDEVFEYFDQIKKGNR